MELLLGLSLFGVAFIVTLIVPILGWVRAAQAMNEVRQLRTRMAALEQELRKLAKARVVPVADAGSDVHSEPVTAPPGAGEVHVAAAPPVETPAQELIAAPAVPEPVPAWSSALRARAATPPEHTGDGRGVPCPNWRRRRSGDWRAAASVHGRPDGHPGAGFLPQVRRSTGTAITEWMRVAIGIVSGIGFVALGLRLARAGYRGYGQILSGVGLAALYLSVYAAFSFYDLIGRTEAFALLFSVTVAAAWLSDRQESQGMAVMAVGGGFLTPFLVGGDADAQITLFSYVALLIVGTLWLARRRGWPLLLVMAYGFTLMTVGAWAADYYTPSKYLRTTLLLTMFCGLFILARWEVAASTTPSARFANRILASAPLLYHIASVGLLFNHGVALLVYLIAVSLVGVGRRRTRASVAPAW